VDTSRHFCPHTDCDYRGWLGLNNLRANGHPSGGPWRQCQCTSCDGYCPEHHGTIFHGKHAAVERMVHVLACLAEGLGIRATARVFEVAPNTVLDWLVAAAEQLRAFSAYFLCEVHVKQLQLDELYAVLSAVKDGEISEAKAIQRLSRSPHWVWVAIDPVTKLLVAIDVGERTLAMTQRFVHHVAQVLAPDCAPLFLTDGFREDATALLTHYGRWVQPPRRRRKVQPKPRWMPCPPALCASGEDRAAPASRQRVSRGVWPSKRQHILAPAHGSTSTQPCGADQLGIRRHVAAVGRRSAFHAVQGRDGHGSGCFVSRVLQLCLPHVSLRQALPPPAQTHGSGSATQWRPCTPAMAAGLTERVWSLREVLLYRVPPWPQPQAL
jgi:hypothetical protein